MSFVERLTAYLRGDGEQTDDGSASLGDVSTRLFHCPTCETTYICAEMDDCPNCNDGVSPVPKESDLGMLER